MSGYDDTRKSASIALLEPDERTSSNGKVNIDQGLHSELRGLSLWRRVRLFARQTSTWRFIVASGLALTIAVLILNVSFLIWSRARPHGGNLLFRGDCGSAKNVVTISSLAINVLSTLLLGASNAAMQCLCAPTKAEVEKVHATGSWLDIGVSGLHNWHAIGRWRRYAWISLLLSTMPLHLLYNSVIVSTSQANDYMALLVTPEFLNGTSPTLDSNTTVSLVPPPAPYSLENLDFSVEDGVLLASALQKNKSGLTKLENEECIRTYGHEFVTRFLNVLLVTNDSQTALDPVLGGYEYHPAPSSDDDSQVLNLGWLCNEQYGCNIRNRTRHASTWDYELSNNRSARVSYCLAQPVNPRCKVEILPEVLAVVIACNVMKVICFASLLMKRNFKPLMILGDAIASFMADPDPTALSSGPLSAESVRKAFLAEPLRFSVQHNSRRWNRSQDFRRVTHWHATRRYWASAVGHKRWASTIIGFMALWFTGFAFLYQEQQNGGVPFSTFWTQGFGSPYPLAVLRLPKGFPLFGIVLLANLPQAILSSVYLVYNDTITCMLVSAEFVRYAHVYKGLRVTLPQGKQRGTYTLSLPLKCSVPLLVASSGLHWAMSQSLFLAKVDVLNPYGKIDGDRSFSTLGWSGLALLILLLFGGLMLVTLVASGFRRFRVGAPTVGSNSRAMLAASFTLGNGQDEALKKLKYGVLANARTECKRVGFGSEDVVELSEDEIYG